VAIFTTTTKKRKRNAVEHAITNYYGTLPEHALEEDKERAEFSLTQFSKRTDYWLPSRKWPNAIK